jgi:ferredoxin
MLRGPGTGFFPWKTYNEDYDELVLDRLNVYMPPKQIIVSPAEKNNINLMAGSVESRDKIIFGIRSCDVQGINFLDEFFAGNEIESEYYHARRDHTIIIANDCYYPASSCFCSSMGIDPLRPAGADIIIRDTGKAGYIWEACTNKGDSLTGKIADLLEEKEVEIPEPLPFVLKVNFDGVMEKLADMNDHPLWEKHSEACQTCALCTYVCPTCYCLDLQAAQWFKTGYEFSCFDSCAYKNETMNTGGSSSRESAVVRFRDRYKHKLQFYPQRYGKPLCTGCGRCIAICPSGADITTIITAVQETNL